MADLPHSDVKRLTVLRVVIRPSPGEQLVLCLSIAICTAFSLSVLYVFHKRAEVDTSAIVLGIAMFLSGAIFAGLFFRRLGLRFFFDCGTLTCKGWGGRLLWKEDISNVTAVRLTHYRSGPELTLEWTDRSRSTFIWVALADYLLARHLSRA